MKTVYIVGESGTSGMRLHDLLAPRTDLRVLSTTRHDRDAQAREADLLNTVDAVVLCLPAAAAVNTLAHITNPAVRILDCSTAHSVAADWTYGLPELYAHQRTALRTATRISGPGCFATGFILALRPLVVAGVLAADAPVSVQGISGYTAGGKKMVTRVERNTTPPLVSVFGLNFGHPQVPEMQHYAGLRQPPLFVPWVGSFPRGMLVSVPLHRSWLKSGTTPAVIRDLLHSTYQGERFVSVGLRGGLATALPLLANQTPGVELFVEGNAEHVLLLARLDNLGKGSAMATIQNLNLSLGLDEGASLSVGSG